MLQNETEEENNIEEVEHELNEEEDEYFRVIANTLQYNYDGYLEDHYHYPELDPEPDADLDDDYNQIEENNIENPNEFNNLYELFRIHTSNMTIFNSNASVDRNTNYYGHTCPICGLEDMTVEQLGSHLVYNHSRLFVSLTTALYPSLTPHDMQTVFNTVQPPSFFQWNNSSSNVMNYGDNDDNMRQLIYRLIFNEESDEVPSYDELIGLCDYIGYHKQGIIDADGVSIKLSVNEELIKNDDTCIICLEHLLTKESVRKIKKCNHIFCSECIEKWFEENKTCPHCKSELSNENMCSDIVNV